MIRALLWLRERWHCALAAYRTWRLFRRGVPQRWRAAEARRRTP